MAIKVPRNFPLKIEILKILFGHHFCSLVWVPISAMELSNGGNLGPGKAKNKQQTKQNKKLFKAVLNERVGRQSKHSSHIRQAMEEAVVPINTYLLSTFFCHKQDRHNLCPPFQCSRKPFITQNRREALENEGFGNYKSDLNIFNILKLTIYN